MPVVSPNYTNVFQDMGKIVLIYNDLDEAGPVVETDIVEMVEQLDRNYQNVKILPTIINNAVTARTSMANGVTNMKSAMDTYLLNALKNDIESTATTASGVLADLRGLMIDDAEKVLLSGVFWDFFDTEYEQDLNSSINSGVVTIPDVWAQ
jgi:SpoU rRNA methylase family enzyme